MHLGGGATGCYAIECGVSVLLAGSVWHAGGCHICLLAGKTFYLQTCAPSKLDMRSVWLLQGSKLDVYAKQWRLFADCLNNVGQSPLVTLQ